MIPLKTKNTGKIQPRSSQLAFLRPVSWPDTGCQLLEHLKRTHLIAARNCKNLRRIAGVIAVGYLDSVYEESTLYSSMMTMLEKGGARPSYIPRLFRTLEMVKSRAAYMNIFLSVGTIIPSLTASK